MGEIVEEDSKKGIKKLDTHKPSKSTDLKSAHKKPVIVEKKGLEDNKETRSKLREDYMFGEFCQLCAKFLVEDPDIETMKRELKDAFRIYDKNGEGFITMDTLRGLISELLSPLTPE